MASLPEDFHDAFKAISDYLRRYFDHLTVNASEDILSMTYRIEVIDKMSKGTWGYKVDSVDFNLRGKVDLAREIAVSFTKQITAYREEQGLDIRTGMIKYTIKTPEYKGHYDKDFRYGNKENPRKKLKNYGKY